MPQKILKRKALHLNSSLTANAIITNKEVYGANHIVIEGAGSIIADTVMNGIFYPRDEVIALANRTKADIHAPSGHPVDEDGNFISAGHPMATQQNFIGAISNNYRMNGDRLVRDISINPEIANRFSDGKEIIRRIENEEDTDTSTGLLLQLEEKSGVGNDGEPFKFIARNMELDHDAILIKERGAATSLQGVGMFANAKGDEFTVDEYTINASIPAMNLSLAPNDFVWNESEALARIKEFTNSKDKPSSNFRRFFLNFDQSNVDSFDSYTNLFADVINGVPHAVKAPIEAVKNNVNATAYNERFVNNKDGVISKAWNVIKSIFMSNKDLSHSDIENKIHEKLNEGRTGDIRHLWPMEIFDTKFVYRSDNDTLFMQSYALVDDDVVFIGERTEVERVVEFKTVSNNNGDRIMREKVIKALNAANVNIEGLDDDAIFAKFESLNKQDDENLTEEEILKRKKEKGKGKKSEHNSLTLDDITAVVNAAIKPLQDKIDANTDKELDNLVEQVEKLDIGISKEAAKTMGVNSCKDVLAKNGVTAFNSSGGYTQHNNSEDGCSTLTLPTSVKE